MAAEYQNSVSWAYRQRPRLGKLSAAQARTQNTAQAQKANVISRNDSGQCSAVFLWFASHNFKLLRRKPQQRLGAIIPPTLDFKYATDTGDTQQQLTAHRATQFDKFYVVFAHAYHIPQKLAPSLTKRAIINLSRANNRIQSAVSVSRSVAPIGKDSVCPRQATANRAGRFCLEAICQITASHVSRRFVPIAESHLKLDRARHINNSVQSNAVTIGASFRVPLPRLVQRAAIHSE